MSLREVLIVGAVAVIATAVMFAVKYPPRLPYADEFEYLGYAFSLYEFGLFGRVVDPTQMPNADMFFPPLYPTFLSVLMALDATFADAARCVLGNMKGGSNGALVTQGCEPDYGFVLYVQVVLAALAMVFVWATAKRLSGSMLVTMLTFVLAFAAKAYVYYANYFLTENLTLPLAAALGWAMVATWQERTVKYAALTGLFFGLLVLNRAGWGYALVVMVPVFLALAIGQWRSQGMQALAPLVTFIVVYGVILAPWVVRNAVEFGTPALTAAYGAKSLTHRLPYNRMTDEEWKIAFVYWLPEFGDKLAESLYPEEAFKRLKFNDPNGFYGSEQKALIADANAKRGDQPMFDYLIEHEILGNLGAQIKVTFAMVWRGMFVSKVWGLVAWVFTLPVLIWAAYRRWWALWVLALPPLFMLGLNAFVSVSIPRYNMVLVPLLAFSTAHAWVYGGTRLRIWLHKRRTA